jgi:hypothetical protein
LVATKYSVCALAVPAIIPATSATPAATDNRFPIADNHPRFLLPVCCLMTFVSCLVFCLPGLFSLQRQFSPRRTRRTRRNVLGRDVYMGLAWNGFTRWRQIPCPPYLSLLFSFFVHFVFFVVISTPASSLQL